MGDHTTDPEQPLEPVHRRGLWIALAVIVLAGVPIYLPSATIDPVILGVPLWLLVSVLAAIAMSALLCYACLRWWSLAEPAETAASTEKELDR